MGVSQNKQLLTEKYKEVASHLLENETIAEADVHSSNTPLVTVTAIVYCVFR